MSFTFSARTILELGKELISSDEVALYELIKNAIDAGSERVEISVHVEMLYSTYREIIASIEEGDLKRSETLRLLERGFLEPISPGAAALLEQLKTKKSKQDFVQVVSCYYSENNYLTVRDTGHGMGIDDLRQVFLRIGTSVRRRENLAGARNLGDKGIGRLSAMRLGNHMRVVTARCKDRLWNLLDIDWGLFSHDDDVDADAIELEPELGEEKDEPSQQGTSIIISGLQSDWDLERFTDVLQGRIARTVDPFVPGMANRLIAARHNGTRVRIPSIPKELLQAAHAVCHVKFRMDGENPILSGEVDYSLRHRKKKITAEGPEVYSLAQVAVKRRAKRGHAAFRLIPVRPGAFKDLGEFECDIYWFNRRVVTAVEGLTTRNVDTRREISNWSGGPMLYRYGFRILPYGDPKDDWLALDETAFGEKGFKLNRQQVIGRVLLTTPHSALSEQTNREGLIASDTLDALRKVLLWVVHTEMRGLINEADDAERIERRLAEEDTTSVSSARRRVVAALERIRKRYPEEAWEGLEDLYSGVESLSVQSLKLIERIEAVMEEADEEREKFIYLAGIGLMTEFIFHELERAVTHTMDLLRSRTFGQGSIDSFAEQLKTLHKRIAAFDELTGEKRQSKSKFDLAIVVDDVLSGHKREFQRHGITLTMTPGKAPLEMRAVRGMVIQIIENLVVNSAYWLKQQKKFEFDFEPHIQLTLNSDEKKLTVEDNGPGVPDDRRERIFQPFITSKPTGQGRGLGLYIARELAKYHGWSLAMDEELDRVRQGRTNMFVLDVE